MIKGNSPDRQLRYLLAKWSMETHAAERGYLTANIWKSGGDSLTIRITHNTSIKNLIILKCVRLFVFVI
jgi:hypothetical protein